MKIKFDSELIYQQDAIKSIFGIFKGQEVCQSNFSVPKWDFKSFSQAEQLQIPLFGKDHAPSVQASLLDDDLKDIGVGNKLSLLPEEILENLIQEVS